VKHENVICPDGEEYQLTRARVPRCFLTEAVPAAAGTDLDGAVLVDIRIHHGRIASLAASAGPALSRVPEIDLEGRMVWPTLVDMHTHLDKGEVIPRALPDGTLQAGALRTAADRVHWTYEDLHGRMTFALRCAYAQGVSAIRTHLDSGDRAAELSWRVFQDLRTEWKGRIALQGVGLAALDFFARESGAWLADLTAAAGGVLGGVTDALGPFIGAHRENIDGLLDNFLGLARERGLEVDLHVDQTADPNAFFLPNVARAVLRTKFPHRVVVDHCVNLALQPEAVARETISLCAEAGIAFVTLPTPMMYLMDRQSGRTPRWRGVTLAQEIRAAGIPIALAGDNCRDAWYPYGNHDMVELFRDSVRIFQLDHPINDIPAMVGAIPAAIIGEQGVGTISVGQEARLILFRARSLNEVMCRPQADRIVLDRGRRILDPLPDYAELDEIVHGKAA
jgi:cytosine deaminase